MRETNCRVEGHTMTELTVNQQQWLEPMGVLVVLGQPIAQGRITICTHSIRWEGRCSHLSAGHWAGTNRFGLTWLNTSGFCSNVLNSDLRLDTEMETYLCFFLECYHDSPPPSTVNTEHHTDVYLGAQLISI